MLVLKTLSEAENTEDDDSHPGSQLRESGVSSQEMPCTPFWIRGTTSRRTQTGDVAGCLSSG